MTWPAFEKWRTGIPLTNEMNETNETNGTKTGMEYLVDLLSPDQMVRTFSRSAEDLKSLPFLQHDYSFKKSNEAIIPYMQFIESIKTEKYPGQYILKDSRRKVGQGKEVGGLELEKLLEDIMIPDFYKDISELEGVEFMQGTYLIEKPHYEKKEQLMCLIDGDMEIRLVPHFNRQEVYSGKQIINSTYNDNVEGQLPDLMDRVNTSPVNFFAPKSLKYPHFKSAILQKDTLKAGDCIFIPAYYFYQFQAYNLPSKFRSDQNIMSNFDPSKPMSNAKYEEWMDHQSENTIATIVSLQFQANSKLLQGFMEAAERGIIN